MLRGMLSMRRTASCGTGRRRAARRPGPTGSSRRNSLRRRSDLLPKTAGQRTRCRSRARLESTRIRSPGVSEDVSKRDGAGFRELRELLKRGSPEIGVKSRVGLVPRGRVHRRGVPGAGAHSPSRGERRSPTPGRDARFQVVENRDRRAPAHLGNHLLEERLDTTVC
jgi:hypothetical protein